MMMVMIDLLVMEIKVAMFFVDFFKVMAMRYMLKE